MQLSQLVLVQLSLPTFKYSKRVLNSTGALNLQELPEKIVVIGGGVIGIELGGAYANFGTQVTILEGADEILGLVLKSKWLPL